MRDSPDPRDTRRGVGETLGRRRTGPSRCVCLPAAADPVALPTTGPWYLQPYTPCHPGGSRMRSTKAIREEQPFSLGQPSGAISTLGPSHS